MRLLRVVLTTLMLLSLAVLPAVAAGCHCHDGHGGVVTRAATQSWQAAAVLRGHASSHAHDPSHHDGAKGCGMMCCASCAFALSPSATLVARVHRAAPVAPSADDPQRNGIASNLSLRPPIAG